MPSKKKHQDRSIDIDDFNRFGLQYTDNKGEAFFNLEGTQVVMNYKCALGAEYILASYRNYLKK